MPPDYHPITTPVPMIVVPSYADLSTDLWFYECETYVLVRAEEGMIKWSVQL